MKLPDNGKLGTKYCRCENITAKLFSSLVQNAKEAGKEGFITNFEAGREIQQLVDIAAGCGLEEVFDQKDTAFVQKTLYQLIGKEAKQDVADVWVARMKDHGEHAVAVKQDDGTYFVFVESL